MGSGVYDFSFDRTAAARIAASDADGAIGYVSPDPRKNITAAELELLHAAHKPVAPVWEAQAGGAAGGYAAGHDAGVTARTQLAQLHWPDELPCYWACDADLAPDVVDPYGSGFRDGVAPHPPGVYGSAWVVGTMLARGVARYGWVWASDALNHGVDPHGVGAALWQRSDSRIAGTDRNDILLPDWGGWEGTVQLDPNDPIVKELRTNTGGVYNGLFNPANAPHSLLQDLVHQGNAILDAIHALPTGPGGTLTVQQVEEAVVAVLHSTTAP